jgi:hypothetical protein
MTTQPASHEQMLKATLGLVGIVSGYYAAVPWIPRSFYKTDSNDDFVLHGLPEAFGPDRLLSSAQEIISSVVAAQSAALWRPSNFFHPSREILGP